MYICILSCWELGGHHDDRTRAYKRERLSRELRDIKLLGFLHSLLQWLRHVEPCVVSWFQLLLHVYIYTHTCIYFDIYTISTSRRSYSHHSQRICRFLLLLFIFYYHLFIFFSQRSFMIVSKKKIYWQSI